MTPRFGTYYIATLLSNMGFWSQQVTEPWLRGRYFDLDFPDYQGEKSEEDWDYTRTQFQGLVVATFLVAAITPVVVVFDDVMDTQLVGQGHGAVPAVVVHQYHFVYDLERYLRVGLAQRNVGL